MSTILEKYTDVIRAKYPRGYSKELARKLKISLNTLYAYASRLGLRKTKKHYGPEGGVSCRTKEGGCYVLYFHGGGRVQEHRYVMERHLGRRLRKTERVHHLNGDRYDNRIVNLKLMRNEREHALWHLAHPDVGRFNSRRMRRDIVPGKLWCPACQKRKAVTCFTKDKSTMTGYRAYCTDCYRVKQRSWRDARIQRARRRLVWE